MNTNFYNHQTDIGKDMSDIECPYCGEDQEVCHDDGFGYSEDERHEMQCGECDRYFVFDTSILFLYKASKADCLNGEEHKFRLTHTYPKSHTKMRCLDCEKTRPCTEEEMAEVLNETA